MSTDTAPNPYGPRADKPGVVITGPQGCGKSRNAELLRRYYALGRVLDDGRWSAGDPIPRDTLVLTHEDDQRAISFATAFTAAVTVSGISHALSTWQLSIAEACAPWFEVRQ